jgi:hypothetical protein
MKIPVIPVSHYLSSRIFIQIQSFLGPWCKIVEEFESDLARIRFDYPEVTMRLFSQTADFEA